MSDLHSHVTGALTEGVLVTQGPGLFVMDVDSTLIEDEVIELLAERAGTREQVAAVTARAMHGELDFAQSLQERVATLAGVPVSVFAEVLQQVRLTKGARSLVQTLHERGCKVGLVSGGFIEVVEPLASDLRIDHVAANRLETSGSVLTGRTVGTVVDRAEKARLLRKWAQADCVALERTVAMGDGANDLDMLATAGLGIAFCAKPVVAQAADAAVHVRDLRAALELF